MCVPSCASIRPTRRTGETNSSGRDIWHILSLKNIKIEISYFKSIKIRNPITVDNFPWNLENVTDPVSKIAKFNKNYIIP